MRGGDNADGDARIDWDRIDLGATAQRHYTPPSPFRAATFELPVGGGTVLRVDEDGQITEHSPHRTLDLEPGELKDRWPDHYRRVQDHLVEQWARRAKHLHADWA